jgi:hypothetical protein
MPGATCANAAGTYFCICSDGISYNCYADTGADADPTTLAITPCTNHICESGKICKTDNYNQALCICQDGYDGNQCKVSTSTTPSTPSSSEESNKKVALIAGLVGGIGGAVLLGLLLFLLFFFVICPRKEKPKAYDRAPSEYSDQKGLTMGSSASAKFDTQSTRINPWWPRSPQRYVPQTYSSAPGDLAE